MLRLKYFIILIILILPAVVASEEGEIDTLDAAYCKNGAVTQNDVNLLLSSLNDQRTKLAKGLQSNGNDEDSVLPPAKNMKKLAYDCDLERKAKLFLDSLDCDNTLSKKPDKGYFYYGDFTGNDLRASDNEDLPCLLRVQSKRINKYGFSSFKTNEPVEYTDDDEKLLFYANLMRAKASKIGCTVRTCPSDKAEVLQYLCFTDQKNIQIREQIYEVGTGENCECDEPMTCEGSLCVTAEFPGPSTADEDEEEPEDHEDEDKDEEEPEDYGFEGEPKEPSTKCTSQEISDTMRMRMQKIHNRLRSQLALGQVKINKRRTLPTASNINYLVWDCALEERGSRFPQKLS
ncbi:unnamed protein product [Cylicocyclus nassatus]|uniref:SCP domain-containing protein n=1 Tax=Cylicocyclus nassatus TaxID=53992 RepID=A0AA36HG41_CYLNA|nr:unnamed protein product [Cylicocyclus nassatus]